MEVLGWLLIPLAALLLALVWAAWRTRERKPMGAEQGMEDMARFRQAMEKPLPPLHHDPVPTEELGAPRSLEGRDSDT
jgi:hypothetical protein